MNERQTDALADFVAGFEEAVRDAPSAWQYAVGHQWVRDQVQEKVRCALPGDRGGRLQGWEDLEHDVYLLLHRDLQCGFPDVGSNFADWLLARIEYRCRDALRQHGRAHEMQLLDHATLIDPHGVANVYITSDVWQQLGELRPLERHIVLLFLRGASTSEIASTVHLSTWQVYQRRRRAIERLRIKLVSYSPDISDPDW